MSISFITFSKEGTIISKIILINVLLYYLVTYIVEVGGKKIIPFNNNFLGENINDEYLNDKMIGIGKDKYKRNDEN